MLLCGSVHYSIAGDRDSKEVSWTTLKTVDNVTIQYQQVKCQQQDMVVLKMINNNDHPVKVGWSLFGGSFLRSVPLEGGQTKLVDCNSPTKELLSQVIPAGKSIRDLNPSFYVR
jgi:hypothetical protein